MTLTLRSASTSVATTKGAALTHAEMDANWLHAMDSSNASFLQSGSGATSRTVQAKVREIVSITDFGGLGDAGTTDNGAKLQLAHDALGSDGGAIWIPPTTTYYGFTTTAVLTKYVVLKGMDWYCSELLTATASLTMITTTKKIMVENINFTASGSASGTAIAIKTLSTATSTNGTLIRNCYFSNFEKAYQSEQTAELRVESCKIAANGFGLHLANTTSSDTGDSFVSNCEFSGTTNDTCIHVASTSGLNISNNKFNTGVGVHIDIAPTTNAVGNFIIGNNSFEGHTTAAIRLIATTGGITKTIINGNQFSAGGASHVIVGKLAKNTNISGNTFNDINAAQGIGIDIQAQALNTTITGNAFHQILTAIKSDASITGQFINGNRFASDVTNYYLGGENDNSLSGPGSEKCFEMDRTVAVTSNADYTNLFTFYGDCIVEVFVTGIVQGAGIASKYRKVLLSGSAGATVTDLIAEVSTGSTFDMQIAAGGVGVVVGVKRNGATGTSVTAQVRVKISGWVKDFSKV